MSSILPAIEIEDVLRKRYGRELAEALMNRSAIESRKTAQCAMSIIAEASAQGVDLWQN